VTAISATLQKPAPQPDREVAPSQPEADGASPPDKGTKGGFAHALRAASGKPAGARADTGGRQADEPDDGTPGQGEAAQAVQGLPATPGLPAAPPAADPTNAAAAILANILNALAPSAPAAGAPPAATGSVAGGVGAADGGPALRSNASAPASTAGSGPLTQGEPDLGVTNAARQAASRTDAADLAGTSLTSLPKVTVLGSAVHFKPVLPQVATRESASSALAASAPVPPGPKAAASPPIQVSLPDPIAAAPRANPTGSPKLATATLSVPAPSQPPSQSQPASGVEARASGVEARAAGAGLDKADLTALADSRAVTGIARAGLTDTRAVTGIARAVLASAGRPEKAQSPDPAGLAGAGPGLPAGTLPTIATAIRDELDRTAGPDAAARAPQTDQAIRTAPDGPLRVLRIQLRPEDLGTVTVELRLTNGQLETHLRASQPETAALLHRDAAILSDLLKQANYQAQVTVGEARPSDTGGFSGNAPSQGQSGSSDGGARPGQGGDRQRQAEQGAAAGRREGERGDETTRPRDGGVYL
jgi:flagellar hook-length control protein FliK